MKSFLCVTGRIISSLAEMTSLQSSVLLKQILTQDPAKWGRKQGMKKRMELTMCPKWGGFRHHRKGIGDSSNLDYNVMHLWNDNIALPVTITPVSVMQKWWGRFPAFSFSSQSSDESCTSTSLVIWGSAQTNICTPFSIHSSIQHTTWNQGKGIRSHSSLQEWQKRQHENITTRKQKEKPTGLHHVLLWSAVFCGSSDSLSKVKWRQPLPPDNLWFYLSQQVGSMCSGERAESFESPSEKRTGRTKTPPFDTTELLQQGSEFGRWWPSVFQQPLTWKSYVLVYTSFWLLWEKSKPAVAGDCFLC